VHGDDQWWTEDLEKRARQIGEWHEATWKELDNGGFGRISSRSNPEKAVAGKDYLVVPPLSDTFTDDRNYQWHSDNVERADRVEAIAQFKSTEEDFNDFVRKVEHFFGRYTALQCNFAMDRRRWQAEMQGALYVENVVRRDFRTKVDQLQEKAKKCGLRIDRSKFEIINQFGLKMQKTVMAAKRQREREACAKTFPAPTVPTQRNDTPTLHLLPRTTYNGGNCKQKPSGKAAAAHEPTTRAITAAPHQSTPCLPAAAAPEAGAISFPAYKDTMTGNAQDIAGTRQDIRKPAGMSRARKNTAKALVCIRSQVGALQAEHPRVDSAHTRGNPSYVVSKSVRFAMVTDSRPTSPTSNDSGYTRASNDSGYTRASNDSDYTTSDAESEALYSTSSDGAGDHRAVVAKLQQNAIAVEETPSECKGSPSAVARAIPIPGRGQIIR